MRCRLRTTSAQPDTCQHDSAFADHDQGRRWRVAEDWLRKDKAVDRPDAFVTVVVPDRVWLMVFGVLVRVRRRVRVDERSPLGVMLVAYRIDRFVSVRIWRRPESTQQCQHGDGCTDTARDHASIVNAAYSACQAGTNGRYNRVHEHYSTHARGITHRRRRGSRTIAARGHEVTHNGTVVALKTEQYAQPGGGIRDVRELEVAVLDPKTKKVANRVFTISDKTKVTRAGEPVASVDVTAQKDEKVAVVVNHDKPGDEAIHVRFATAK